MLLQVCRKTAYATLLATSLLATSLLPVLLTAFSASASTGASSLDATAATGPSLAISLTAITPTVAVPKAPITITGSARNTGPVAITSPVARALLGQSPLTSRKAVSDWAGGTGEQPMTEVARAPLGKTLAPGAVTTFVLTVPAADISHRDSFGVLPLRVELVGRTVDGRREVAQLQTFLPTLSAIKAYEPVSVAWLIPLTLDPDPALHGMNSPARTTAWAKAIGPGSRLDNLITATQDANVTWAIDPAILGPRQTSPAGSPPAEPAPSPSDSEPPTPGAGTTADPVTAATTALAERLKAASSRHTLWSLPYADPDLSAVLPIASGNPVLAALISHPSTLDGTVGPARTDIAWPVDGKLAPRSEARLRRAFKAQGLAAAVTPASTLPKKNRSAGASRRSSTGLPLLAYDEALSRTVGHTSSRAAGALTIQRFLADSMALLGERPGTRNRSVLIAEPRTFAGDPVVLSSLFAAVAKAPWLTPTTTDQLLAASRKAPREAPDVATTPTPKSPPISLTASDQSGSTTSPLTSEDLAAMPGELADIRGVGSTLVDGVPFISRWTDAQTQLLSARWRGHPEGITAVNDATKAAVSTVSRSVRVAPSSVNFFADRGVMQVTVVNDLDVPIHNVRLTLNPAQPRLRIEKQPELLKIGAKSRTNVKVPVTSIAAGLVRIEADLTTPNGTPLGENASVAVRVQPPSTWIYWALGALAGLVLVLGTYRSLRRGSTRGSRPDAQELPLNDRVLND
jgi:Family of unknown function (DUF6049)